MDNEVNPDIHDIVDEMVKAPTLDKFLDRHPATLKFPEDYLEMVKNLRVERAMFIKNEAEKKAKKKGQA